MVVGHTKFAPHTFAKVAKAFACSDVFTTEELAVMVSDCSVVATDNGELMSSRRDRAGEKYTELPGNRDYIVW